MKQHIKYVTLNPEFITESIYPKACAFLIEIEIDLKSWPIKSIKAMPVIAKTK